MSKLEKGAQYTHIVANPKSEIYGDWIICSVIKGEETYGYFSEKDNLYILHNTEGSAFVTIVGSNRPEFDPNIYALHGKIYVKEEWVKRLRESKLKRILTVK